MTLRVDGGRGIETTGTGTRIPRKSYDAKDGLDILDTRPIRKDRNEPDLTEQCAVSQAKE